MNIPDINSIIWRNQSPDELMRIFEELELEHKPTASQWVSPSKTQETLFTYPDGYKWVNLNKSGCEIEGGAMGHCGNGAGARYDTVLSLRQIGKNNLERPCLTFILDLRDHSLGEMKGRGNSKPSSKYHDKIMSLLLNYDIEYIKPNFGYLPENNFKISDLNDEQILLISKHKPNLLDTKSYYKLHGVDNEIKDRVKDSGLRLENINEIWYLSKGCQTVNQYSYQFDTNTETLINIAFYQFTNEFETSYMIDSPDNVVESFLNDGNEYKENLINEFTPEWEKYINNLSKKLFNSLKIGTQWKNYPLNKGVLRLYFNDLIYELLPFEENIDVIDSKSQYSSFSMRIDNLLEEDNVVFDLKVSDIYDELYKICEEIYERLD